MLAESSHDEEDDEEDAPIEDDRWLLTPLGEHVASLPVDCRVGKLLIYGCVFGCADACLTAAARMSLARGLWRAPPQLRREASLAKKRLAQGDGSDLLAAVRAHEAASALDAEARRRFCRDNFVDERALQELGGLRRQFRSHLVDAGLLDADAPRRPLADALALVRGLLVAGLNPHAARKDREARTRRCGARQPALVGPPAVRQLELLGGRGDAPKPRYVVYNARLKTSKPTSWTRARVARGALPLRGRCDGRSGDVPRPRRLAALQGDGPRAACFIGAAARGRRKARDRGGARVAREPRADGEGEADGRWRRSAGVRRHVSQGLVFVRFFSGTLLDLTRARRQGPTPLTTNRFRSSSDRRALPSPLALIY